MNIGTRYHTLGLFSSRTGAAGQITAVDDAVKATGTEFFLSNSHVIPRLGWSRQLYRDWWK